MRGWAAGSTATGSPASCRFSPLGNAELHGLGDEVAEAEDHARRVQKLDSFCKLADSAGRAEFIHPTGRAFLHGFTATRLRRPRRSRDRPRRALTPEGRAPNGAGQVSPGEPEPPELVVWHEFLDQRKELSLLKPDVCLKQFPPPHPTSLDRRCRPSRRFRVCERTPQAARVGRVPRGGEQAATGRA